MRKLLAICDVYAYAYDIVFNASKSKYLVITSGRHRALYRVIDESVFLIGNKPVEFVKSFTHLGHIIKSNLDDDDDILHRRNCFVGQANNALCFFNKLDTFVKVRLFKSFCSSLYGCELWALDNDAINELVISWRKALRRILDIPYNSHSYLLPLVTDSLPVFDELCKRSARFIISCLISSSNLVRSVVRYALMARFNSVIGKNALICCQRFGWAMADFCCGNVALYNSYFLQRADEKLTVDQIYSVVVLMDAINIREGYSVFDNGNFMLSRSELQDIINFVATK